MTEAPSTSNLNLSADYPFDKTDLPEVIESFVEAQVKEMLEEHKLETEHEIELEVQWRIAKARTESALFSSDTKLLLDTIFKQTQMLEYITEQQTPLNLQNKIAQLCVGGVYFDTCVGKLHSLLSQLRMSCSSCTSKTESETELDIPNLALSLANYVPCYPTCPPPVALFNSNQEPTEYGTPPKKYSASSCISCTDFSVWSCYTTENWLLKIQKVYWWE